MIADMTTNKKFNAIVSELLVNGRKLNISFVFISQSYFKVPKDFRLSCTHFLLFLYLKIQLILTLKT